MEGMGGMDLGSSASEPLASEEAREKGLSTFLQQPTLLHGSSLEAGYSLEGEKEETEADSLTRLIISTYYEYKFSLGQTHMEGMRGLMLNGQCKR